jgi:FemAB-related protein (PEP-CTERM system-associated)
MRDLGSPPHSREFIAGILEQFPDNSWLITIRSNNRPVSAGLLLAYKDTMEIPLASTIRDVNSFSMNMLLYWEVLQFAINRGCKSFDFGRSSKDTGTYNFKKQWGAKPRQLYWHYWLGKTLEIPAISPTNPKYALIIYIWRRLPVFVTTLLGPWIVKNIP